ncbi:bacteriohemerythrin [Clostridium frigoris]|uniref:Bacteriohemerythrin n=1 Tax=Clostridium frigoris TaxID=205327 RepID=A0ABS6BVC2_9CLOT|nr:bacteriohemerythrin [Clostridium frigoris]MBU3160274.1 bacteriohemerythrin [Clostridium frigoris]
MVLFVWEDKYKVGIAELDEQHKTLIGLINKLYNAMKQGHGKDVLKSILDDLLGYVKYHFGTEEKYFTKYNYINKNEQIKSHNDFKNTVIEFKKKFEDGNTFISTELMNFLKNWLGTHILESDMKYGKFLNEKGVY